MTERRWRSAALAALACLVPVRVGALELAGRAVDTSCTPIAGAQVELQRVVPFYERSRLWLGSVFSGLVLDSFLSWRP